VEPTDSAAWQLGCPEVHATRCRRGRLGGGEGGHAATATTLASGNGTRTMCRLDSEEQQLAGLNILLWLPRRYDVRCCRLSPEFLNMLLLPSGKASRGAPSLVQEAMQKYNGMTPLHGNHGRWPRAGGWSVGRVSNPTVMWAGSGNLQ
jgi:hypothetical protein